MTIPSGSNYPEAIDSEVNLLTAHDGLRMRLVEDYTPGDTSITVDGDAVTFSRFPDTGHITLTEQCSEIDERAISFYYNSKTALSDELFTFNELELLPKFTDVSKPKRVTNVVQQVMSQHHEALKDAIIAVEEFVGVQGTVDRQPFGDTMEGRVNFLHRLVLEPRAWFTADKTVGLVPLEVTFTEQAFQIGENCPVSPVVFKWDFGDGHCSFVSYSSISSFTPPEECPSTISVISQVPVRDVNVIVIDEDGGAIKKTYTKPGIYDVTLTVTNRFGEDVVIFPGFINAKIPAPDEATISISPSPVQIYNPPVLRSPVNTFINMGVPTGKKPGSESGRAPYGRTYAGEALNASLTPIDPVVTWTWELSDDLSHDNTRSTSASYSIGGIYDIVLRVDTEFAAYRITTIEDALDIVENVNLWLWIETNNNVAAYEFGLISETFKAAGSSLKLIRNTDFLEGESNAEQLIREFKRNTYLAPASITPSGEAGSALLYWASGRSASEAPGKEDIKVRRFNGFTDSYVTPLTNPSIDRPWNWVAFDLLGSTSFLLGNVNEVIPPYTSPTNQEKLTHNLSTLATTTTDWDTSQYLNGADELEQNVATYDGSGQPIYGHFSAYRTAVKGSVGYFARNDGVGNFFRIKSFYKTGGTLVDPFATISKLADIAGTTKVEGELVDLTSGLFFFNNSAAISAYNDTTDAWETGGASSDSQAFTTLQDRDVLGFNSLANTLLATSDSDRRAYLSYDYSPNAFIQFNSASLVFSSLGSRPTGTQWMMSVY
jgi:PKD repeat protein